MALQSSSSHEAATWRKLGTALLIAVAIVALMALLTVALGIQTNGPFYDIVADPAGLSGLPF